MEHNKYLTEAVKALIVRASDAGKSNRTIASEMGIPRSTIGYTLKAFRERQHLKVMPKSGRPKSTTIRQQKAIVKASKNDPRKTAVLLQSEFRQSHQILCSVWTIRRLLRKNNLFGRRPVKKPLVSLKNRKARVKFAKDHLNWTTQQWAKVLWSDESKFNMFGSDGVKYVRRPIGHRNDPKYQLPTVKHGGGSVMVWGCFSRDCVGPIHEIRGIMDKEMYKGILQNVMLPHAKNKMPRGWIFQDDNDPKHTSLLVKNFKSQKKIRVLDWPSQSPDLNPIEHLWEHVERQMSGKKPSNKQQLFNNIKEIWENISLDVIIKLIDSMPRRCQAVIDAKGFPTKY